MELTANALFSEAWLQLAAAVTQRKHGFHTPVLATAGPEARVMVLRRVDREARELWFHTDARSSKVLVLSNEPEAAVVAYDASLALQVRLVGRVHVHAGDSIAARQWEATKLLARRCYLGEAGSSSITAEPHPGFPEAWRDREPTAAESQPGFANFAVLRFCAESIEVLKLSYKGHLRVRTDFTTTEWLIP